MHLGQEASIWNLAILHISDLCDFDLGSGHTACCRVSIIDLYLHTKFRSNLWTDGQIYGWTMRPSLSGRLRRNRPKNQQAHKVHRPDKLSSEFFRISDKCYVCDDTKISADYCDTNYYCNDCHATFHHKPNMGEALWAVLWFKFHRITSFLQSNAGLRLHVVNCRAMSCTSALTIWVHCNMTFSWVTSWWNKEINLERILCDETPDSQTPCRQSDCTAKSDDRSSLLDTWSRPTTTQKQCHHTIRQKRSQFSKKARQQP